MGSPKRLLRLLWYPSARFVVPGPILDSNARLRSPTSRHSSNRHGPPHALLNHTHRHHTPPLVRRSVYLDNNGMGRSVIQSFTPRPSRLWRHAASIFEVCERAWYPTKHHDVSRCDSAMVRSKVDLCWRTDHHCFGRIRVRHRTFCVVKKTRRRRKV